MMNLHAWKHNALNQTKLYMPSIYPIPNPRRYVEDEKIDLIIFGGVKEKKNNNSRKRKKGKRKKVRTHPDLGGA